MLESSGSFRLFSKKSLDIELFYEFRICLLVLAIDSSIAMPLSFFFESDIARRVIVEHVNFLESGYIQIITDFSDVYGFIEHKQNTYKKAISVKRYKSAYFKDSLFGINKLQYQTIGNTGNIGGSMILPWSSSLTNRADQIGYSNKRISEFIIRVNETEKQAFLYHNMLLHMKKSKISERDAALLQIRSHYNKEYLMTYQSRGFAIPFNSTIVSNLLLPNKNNHKYNMMIWRRIFSITGFEKIIKKITPAQLMQLKLNQSFYLATEKIKLHLQQSKHIDKKQLNVMNDIRKNLGF